ncbi:MAG: alpha/beta fold hydrolase, partial [Marinosulfonomonas sp.]|nr:alpha/beta fold hydrolase [Marinosulfonomonas sp.]
MTQHNRTSVEIPSGTFTLQGELLEPKNPPSTVVVLNSAAGISFGYYRKFAKWLAEEKGMACLIYDYRDFGQSRNGRMKGSVTSMSDWGIHDQQAAREWLYGQFPDAKVWIIGHSLGGMMLPFQTKTDRIDRVITVA